MRRPTMTPQVVSASVIPTKTSTRSTYSCKPLHAWSFVLLSAYSSYSSRCKKPYSTSPSCALPSNPAESMIHVFITSQSFPSPPVAPTSLRKWIESQQLITVRMRDPRFIAMGYWLRFIPTARTADETWTYLWILSCLCCAVLGQRGNC